jgi:hypothetical protein
MPLGLNPNCIQRLRDVVAAAIPQVQVSYGSFIAFESLAHLRAADNALPQTGSVHDRLLGYVGDQPASTFVHERLIHMVRARYHGDVRHAPVSQPLQSIPDLPDADALAAQLIAEFESLPWEYSVALAMPKPFSAVFATEPRTVELRDGLSIVAHDETYEATYPLSQSERRGANPWLMVLRDIREHGASYVQLRATGFIGPLTTTAPLEAIHDTVRQFTGLAVALGLFAPPQVFGDFQRPGFVVHRKKGEHWFFDFESNWDSEQARAFMGLELDRVFGNVEKVLGMTDSEWMLRLLSRIAHAFKEDASPRLKRGAQWLYDSFCEQDLPLAFVEAAVVMEVLLGGDKAASETAGLVELLSSRLAYLVGETQAERESLVREFKDIYGVRSRIVHEGKSTLSMTERDLLVKLHTLCRRVIRKEALLLRTAGKD